MKNCLFFLAFLLAKTALSQVNDNFSDGDFSQNPVWTGSNSGADFVIINDAGVNRLRSNLLTPSSNFYLSTPNTLASGAVWEFWCNLLFNTSGSNYVDIYLVSDQQNLQSASINGYFIRIGGTDDEISLFKRTGAANTSVKLIDGINGILNSSNSAFKIRVTRTDANVFILERDLTGVGFDYFTEGSMSDNTINNTNYFGIYIVQSTASFVQKHFFADFKITPYVPDTTPPSLISATAIDSNLVQIEFNEPMDSVLAKSALNYVLNNGIGNPVSISTNGNSAKYKLKFTTSLPTGNYALAVSNVTDKAGNVILNNNTVSFDYVKPYIAKPNDVVINEVFADTSPQIDLPALEFIELWNTTEFTISLDKWTYSDGSTTYTFGNQTLQANEFAILCASADVANFTSYGKVVGISPWPSLNNSGDQLSLKNSNGILINQVAYTDTWYKDAIKKQGGWSLELINPTALCSGIQNWSASNDPSGGTPGKLNSIYQANAVLEPLKLVATSMIDSVSLLIHYNRSADSTSAATISHYDLNNGVGQPISATAIGPYFEQVQIKFANPPVLGKNYTLTANQVSDCVGNLLLAPYNTASFFLAEKIQKNDILINEVLFNPRVGGVDFVEIYNQSDYPLDLKELRIASLNEKDSLISVKSIGDTQLLIQPKEYRVLTTNPDNIQAEYTVTHPERLYQMVAMPSFNDDAGAVVLIRNDSLLIDQFNYTEKMHFPLIKNPEGVSLERTSFTTPSNEPGNFRSAAASVGFATPGEQNSQYISDHAVNENISLESSTFSPDNDGFEDVLIMHYNFNQPGMVANLTIYADNGLAVRKVLRNTTLASSGSLVWDGLNDQNEKLPVGIYLIRLEAFDLSGKVKNYTKVCVLATKLN